MSKRAVKKIMQGIEETRAYLGGTTNTKRFRVHKTCALTRKPRARRKLLKNP